MGLRRPAARALGIALALALGLSLFWGSASEAAKKKAQETSAEETRIVGRELHDCEEVRLDGPGGSMEHVAVRDQGELPICFGETAAQLTDAWRFTHGDTDYDFQTSGLIAALGTYHAENEWELDNGGYAPNAIAAIRRGGACSRAVTLESQDILLASEIVDLLKEVRYRRNESPDQRTELTEGELGALARYVGKPYCLASSGALPGFEEVLRVLNDADPLRMISEVLAHPCQGTNLRKVSVPPLLTGLTAGGKSGTQIANYYLDRIRSKTDMPVEIAFCQKVFDDPNFRLGRNKNACDKDMHALLLIGKRPNPLTGQCEFLLRNSWGVECGASGIFFDCENGSIWMDAETLSGVTIEAYELGKGRR
ncbi:MAG: hypothetical protein NDJ90_07780 [Oligoflexia bacterium]|nr:hypothetical protein [Oligoflexia bacterium]